MDWIKNHVHKTENTKYYASIRSNGGHLYNWQVNVHWWPDSVFRRLRENPDVLHLTIAKMDDDWRNGQWCTLIICKDKEEHDKMMATGDYFTVFDLWEEKEETTVTTNTIAQRKIADE